MQDLSEKVRLLKIIMHFQYLRPKPMTNSYSPGALDEVMTNTNEKGPGLVGQHPLQHKDRRSYSPGMASLPADRHPAPNEEFLLFLSSCPSPNRILEKMIHSFQILIQRVVGKNTLVIKAEQTFSHGSSGRLTNVPTL